MKSINSHDGLVICRCENVTLGKIRESVTSSGACTVNEVKKLTRAGMGLCQGRTCAPTVELILEKEARTSLGSEPYHPRPPVRPVALADLAAASEDFTEPTGPVSVVMLRKPTENSGTTKSSRTGESR